MSTNVYTMTLIVFMTLIGAPACADQDKGSDTAAGNEQSTVNQVAEPAAQATLPAEETGGEQVSVMDMPVNFSTPEDVEKSIEKVRQEAGEIEAIKLTNALGYILAYDLSFARDKEKMYKKLNGRTPNAIIAKMKR